MDTRTVAEVVLDQPTRIYADLRWFANATLLELWANDKKVFTTTDVSNNSFVIGKEQLSIWGTNTLKLKAARNGMPPSNTPTSRSLPHKATGMVC